MAKEEIKKADEKEEVEVVEEEVVEEEKDLTAQIKELKEAMKELATDAVKEASDERKAKMYDKTDKTPEDAEMTELKALKGKDKVHAFVKNFLGTVAGVDGAREKLQVLVEGTAALGGFLVPEEWRDEIIAELRDATVIRPRATIIPMTTDTLHLPQLSSRPKVYWTSEAATKSTSTAEWSEITFTPYVLAVIVVLSRQLVMDASVGVGSGIVSYVTQLITQAIAEEEDRVFTVGNGTGQPTGINNYSCSLHNAVNAGGALSGDDLIQVYYQLGQKYRSVSTWIMNSRTISVVKQLKDSNNRYLFNDALTAGGYPTLLGRPVLEQNDLPSANILFGDISKYYIAQREGITVATSEEAYVASTSMFETNSVAVRVEERVDGELVDTDAFVEITNTGVA